MRSALYPLLLASPASSFLFYDDYFSTSDYLSLSAADKQSKLWDKIVEDEEPSSFPYSFKMLFVELSPTFQSIGDAMSASWFWGQRTKWIHSVGPVAKVKFIPASG